MAEFEGHWEDCKSCDGTGEEHGGGDDICLRCGGSGMVWIEYQDEDNEDG